MSRMAVGTRGTGPAAWNDEEVLTVFVSRYMPCEYCGESLDNAVPHPHLCSPERRAEFQMFAMRDDVADFDNRFRAYLDSAHGRFDVWLAVKQLRETD